MAAGRPPEWLRVRIGKARLSRETADRLARHGVHTVCSNAQCPNIGECYGHGTATFLIMGDVCTRNCGFCAVRHGAPTPLDPGEPGRVAAAAAELELSHVVVTSVTRDDLPDGGAGHIVATIREIRSRLPAATVEVLIPDLGGSEEAIAMVARERPEVLNHNLETVRRLQPEIRPQASYEVSLNVLRLAGELAPGLVTKSGLMLGLGESLEEVAEAMADLRAAGCSFLTLGQYLRPSPRHHEIQRYVTPEEFDELGEKAREMGFLHCASGPFVRSSYDAGTAASLVKNGGRGAV
jgi:lipoic acid synthetase